MTTNCRFWLTSHVMLSILRNFQSSLKQFCIKFSHIKSRSNVLPSSSPIPTPRNISHKSENKRQFIPQPVVSNPLLHPIILSKSRIHIIFLFVSQEYHTKKGQTGNISRYNIQTFSIHSYYPSITEQWYFLPQNYSSVYIKQSATTSSPPPDCQARQCALWTDPLPTPNIIKHRDI